MGNIVYRFYFFFFFLTVPLVANYLSMYWTNLYQIFSVVSHMDWDDQSEIHFPITHWR